MKFRVRQSSKLVNKKPKVFLKWVYNRIKKNQNAIIVFNGGTGTAKSYACLRLGVDLSELFGTPFSVKNNLDFKFVKLLYKMGLDINSNPGTIFIMEEVGAFDSGASAREWQSEANKFFHTFLQTSRHRNQVFILNCPSFSYLEKGSRELVHFQFEAMGINHKIKRSNFKPFAIQCNRRTGKLYFKYLRYSIKGTKYFMDRMQFKLPPKRVIREYEEAKDIFTSRLKDKILNGGKKKDKKKEHTHDWRARMRTMDKYCRKCGKIEKLGGCIVSPRI